MSQLDRRDQLPDYYADLARMPTRSAQVFKRLCWNERFKDRHLKEIEKLRSKTVIHAQKEALNLYEKLNYFENLKRQNPNEIDRIEKLKERNRLSFLLRKKEFYETIEKLEKGIFIEPVEFKTGSDNGKSTVRLKSAIKQYRSSSSKTSKSVTFNLRANRFHSDSSSKENITITNSNNQNYLDTNIREKGVIKQKSKSLSDLYRIPADILPELGEEVAFRNKNDLIKKKIIIDK